MSFVASRSSNTFKKTSADNRDRAKNNKYHQKRSRRGCARLEQDLLAESASSGNPMTSITRGTMWKALRRDKETGKFSVKAQEIAEKIDILAKRASDGEFPDSGREDELFKALGNVEEHGGRVRGVGLGVSITGYFGRLADPKESRDKVKDLETIVKVLANEVWDLKSIVQQGQHQKAPPESSSPITTEAQEEELIANCNSPIEFPEGLTACQVALSDPCYRIVARGKVHNIPNIARIVHGVPLKPNQVRVSIEYVYENETLLPIPIEDEAYTLREALGTHVAWPSHLVILEDKDKVKEGKRNPSTPVASKDKVKEATQPSPVEKSTNVSTSKSTFEGNHMEVVPNIDTLPHELRLCFMYAKRMKEDEQIMIPIEKAVVNRPQQIYLGREEIFQLLAQHELGACHMAAYILGAK